MSKGTEEKVGEREGGVLHCNFWFNTLLSLKGTVEFVGLGDCFWHAPVMAAVSPHKPGEKKPNKNLFLVVLF